MLRKTLCCSKLFLLGAVLLSALLFNACSKDDDNSGSGDYTPLGNIDITNASSLFIADSASSKNAKAAGDTTTLFKITDDGYIQEVTYEDENGNVTTRILSPTGVFNVNNDYVVVIFGSGELNPTEGYLVRKSDGAVFDMGNTLPIPPTDDFKNSKMIKIDGSGNLYYIYLNGPDACLRKVNIQDPENLTSERVNPDTDTVHSFSVSSDGHVIYKGYLVSEMTAHANRVIKSNGGLYDILNNYFAHWTGLNGDLFFTAGYDTSYFVRHVAIDGSFNVTVADYGSALTGIPDLGYSSYLINLGDKIIIYNTTNTDTFFEVDNDTQTPETVTLTPDTFSQVVDVAYSDNYVYMAGTISGGGTIEKVDPDTGAMTQLLSPGNYSIYKIAVNSSEAVTFNALRYSDGVKIVGTIDASGSGPYSVTIIDETSDIEITTLERIN